MILIRSPEVQEQKFYYNLRDRIYSDQVLPLALLNPFKRSHFNSAVQRSF